VADQRLIPAARLREQAVSILLAAGVTPAHARDCAEVLVLADARGFEGNGVMQLPAYVRHLQSGELTAKARIRRRRQGGMLIVDGGGGLGHVVARQAFRWAIELSARSGVVIGRTHSHGYTGVLGVHVREAARQGLLALFLQTTHPFLGLPGSRRQVIGNNPVAFSAPVPGEEPLVFDMACSTTSLGRIRIAAVAGEAIPAGWAVDQDGQATTDAAAAMLGGLLPAAGHKGLGLAMIVECLAGALAAEARKPAQLEGFFLVVNPALVSDPDSFSARMAEWIEVYRSGGPDLRLPGRRAEALEAERERDGIPVPDAVLDQLRTTAGQVGAEYRLAVEA
jgi:LDH2 family malate/lactate/ureidoglycolate dehydrogenase